MKAVKRPLPMEERRERGEKAEVLNAIKFQRHYNRSGL
jgi:hypothetical protein